MGTAGNSMAAAINAQLNGTEDRSLQRVSDSSDRLIMDLFRTSRDRFSSLDVAELPLSFMGDEDRSLKRKTSAHDSRQLLLSGAHSFGGGNYANRLTEQENNALADENFVLEWAHSVDPEDWGFNQQQLEGGQPGSQKPESEQQAPEPRPSPPTYPDGDEDYVPIDSKSRKRQAVSRLPVLSKAGKEEFVEENKKRKCIWRKYGQKVLKGKEFVGMDVIRCYYRCNVRGCKVKKQVEKASWQTDAEASVSITGIHSHPYENDTISADDEEAAAPSVPDGNKVLAVSRPHRSLRDPPPVPPLNKTLSNEIRESSPHFVISDPSRPDCPIIFASPGFCRLTGYSIDECVGRNCRFLQGKDSNPNAIRQISMACKLQKEIRVILLNYKKDGTPFWNLLHITPVKDSDGNLISFVGVQMDVSERCAEGLTPSIDTSFRGSRRA